MKSRHFIVLTIALACTVQAEGQNWLSRFYYGWLTKPRNVDSTYIYQQSMGFTPSLTSNFSRQRVQMTSTLMLEDFPVVDDNGDVQSVDVYFSAIDKMEEGLSQRAGFILGLGRLGAGWSFELAPDSSQKSSTFLFSFRGNKFGLNINYLGFNQTVLETCEWEPGNAFPTSGNETDTIATDNRVRRLTVDGYYVINTRRFAYPPGIAGTETGDWRKMRGVTYADLMKQKREEENAAAKPKPEEENAAATKPKRVRKNKKDKEDPK